MSDLDKAMNDLDKAMRDLAKVTEALVERTERLNRRLRALNDVMGRRKRIGKPGHIGRASDSLPAPERQREDANILAQVRELLDNS